MPSCFFARCDGHTACCLREHPNFVFEKLRVVLRLDEGVNFGLDFLDPESGEERSVRVDYALHVDFANVSVVVKTSNSFMMVITKGEHHWFLFRFLGFSKLIRSWVW